MKGKNLVPARPYLNKKLKNKSIKILFDEEKTKPELAQIVRIAREKSWLISTGACC